MNPLVMFLGHWVGTVYTIRVLRGQQQILLVPNRGRDYEPDPVTTEQLRASFGPGQYRVEVLQQAVPYSGLFSDPVDVRFETCAAIVVNV